MMRSLWRDSPRWRGIERPYSAEDVVRLRGTIAVEHSIARLTSEKLWRYVNEKPFVNSLGALTGNQAMQQVKAGLDAIYLSGWQVAGDANLAGQMYPDQSLYPADSVPAVVRRINATLKRADELHHAEGDDSVDWFKPIVADAEAGFGGVLNAFELMKQMIDAGAAGVHFEDQLSSAKKCGHMGGKVLVPTQDAINKLAAARLAADVSNVPTVLLARTDAESANLLTSDVDERDRPFIDTSKGRTAEGFFPVKAGIEAAADDMAMAVTFVRANAVRFGVDPHRLALGGFSAGARTALNVAYGERVPVSAVVSISGFMGPDDLTRHVTGEGQPPVLLFSGEHDLDYIAKSFAGTAAYFRAKGLLHGAHVVPTVDHFYPATSTIPLPDGKTTTVEEVMAKFFATHLARLHQVGGPSARI